MTDVLIPEVPDEVIAAVGRYGGGEPGQRVGERGHDIPLADDPPGGPGTQAPKPDNR